MASARQGIKPRRLKPIRHDRRRPIDTGLHPGAPSALRDEIASAIRLRRGGAAPAAAVLAARPG